ncbi:hypothetical protein AXF42_Ash005587 [Apostasia shenzhenica]|uniref:Uncharacterized protein n=1 Tax=Apostasia shenzhenica TaxID=1088818 RepID=A0A2I0BBT3_9ASPA|nr:hypothetical protein AXF42_Ash005587 [Apostasia shenzhenica]
MALLLFIFAPSTVAESRRPITDVEIKDKKNACYADIESGLWGWKCKSSITDKENCALQCLSPACYRLIYESDPVRFSLIILVTCGLYQFFFVIYVLCCLCATPNLNIFPAQLLVILLC